MTSPRMRRLSADYEAVRALCRESSILDVSCSGDPPTTYLLKFTGRGLAFKPGTGIHEQMEHSVRVRLGSSYPRQIPELHWLTPIYHPNISANGLVCLGGYTTNWVPSLKLDDLCQMLWDMIRYRNFDPASPYNRMAAEWARAQRDYILPLDSRPLRDRPVDKHLSPDAKPAPDPKILTAEAMNDDLDWAQRVGKLSGTEVVGSEGVELLEQPPMPHYQEEPVEAALAENQMTPDDNDDQDILFIS